MAQGIPDLFFSLLSTLHSRQGLARRLRGMTVLWLGLGLLVGAASTPTGEGPIARVAFLLAGTIILTPLGLVLGLLGGQALETALGAAGGAVLGAAGLLLLPSGGPPRLFATSVLFGALVGATLGTVLRAIVWVAERALPRRSPSSEG